MTSLVARPAAEADLSRLVALWQEKMTLLQQVDARLRLAPDAAARWTAAARDWLGREDFLVIAAEKDAFIYGYAIGCLQDAPPGLIPARVGVITEIAIDAHRQLGGVGRVLVDALRVWFAEQGIMQVTAQVPHRYAVEQAFWRALGAKEWIDNLWLKL